MADRHTSLSSEAKAAAELDAVRKDLRVVAALVRTAFSSEQSLMSWIRTALSLFTFGFSITQFFHFLEKQQPGVDLSEGPRRLGLALICIGLAGLVLAMAEHVRRLRVMREYGLPSPTRFFLPLGSALTLFAVGLLAFAFTVFDWSL